MRNFANRFHRQMVNGFVGDPAPADPMAAGLVWSMLLDRPDKPDRATGRFQGYFTSNVPGLTCTLTLWIHGILTDWVQVGAALAAVGQNVSFEVAGTIEDADAHVRVVPSAPLGVGETIDLWLEEIDDA